MPDPRTPPFECQSTAARTVATAGAPGNQSPTVGEAREDHAGSSSRSDHDEDQPGATSRS